MKNTFSAMLLLTGLVLLGNSLSHSEFLQQLGETFPLSREVKGDNFFLDVRYNSFSQKLSLWLEYSDEGVVYHSFFASDNITNLSDSELGVSTVYTIFDASSSKAKTESLIQSKTRGYGFVIQRRGYITLKYNGLQKQAQLSLKFLHRVTIINQQLEQICQEQLSKVREEDEALKKQISELMIVARGSCDQNSSILISESEKLKKRIIQLESEASQQKQDRYRLRQDIRLTNQLIDNISRRIQSLEGNCLKNQQQNKKTLTEIKSDLEKIKTGSISCRNNFENSVISIDRSSPYIEEFQISGSNLTYRGDDSTWTQIFGTDSITEKNNCSIKIIDGKLNLIKFGVIDNTYREIRNTASQRDLPNQISYSGYTKQVFEGGEPSKYMGGGFKTGDTVSFEVDQSKGEIVWNVNNKEEADTASKKLTYKGIKWVPYVALFSFGTKIEWIGCS